MTSPADEYALLMEAATPTDAELAKSLLAEKGIPCIFHGQDRDFAELGEMVHMMVSRPDVYVPREALERAVEILRGAWGEFSPPLSD
jgi:hypothetical protein